MNESFDQQPGQSPSPWTGARQTAQSGGSAISSAARRNVRAAFAARLTPGELANPAPADMSATVPCTRRVVIAYGSPAAANVRKSSDEGKPADLRSQGAARALAPRGCFGAGDIFA